MVATLEVDDPTTIDWPRVQAEAWIPFRVVNRRPVNPFAPTGVRRGRHRMRHWAERKCVDPAVTCTVDGKRYLLLVDPKDGRGWSLPGGGLKRGEHVRVGLSRELYEETGLPVRARRWRLSLPRYMPDLRGSDESWPVSVVGHVDLGVLTVLPPVQGADDASRAAFVLADTFVDLTGDLAVRFDGVECPAHRFVIAEILQAPVDDAASGLLAA